MGLEKTMDEREVSGDVGSEDLDGMLRAAYRKAAARSGDSILATIEAN